MLLKHTLAVPIMSLSENYFIIRLYYAVCTTILHYFVSVITHTNIN